MPKGKTSEMVAPEAIRESDFPPFLPHGVWHERFANCLLCGIRIPERARYCVDHSILVAKEQIELLAAETYGGKVYFVSAVGTDRVKIGFTSGTMRARIDALQTGCPFELKEIASLLGPIGLERSIHKYLAPQRVNLEWFRNTGPVAQLIELAGRRSFQERIEAHVERRARGPFPPIERFIEDELRST